MGTGREDCGIWSFLPILPYCLVMLICMQLMQAKGIVSLPRIESAYVICTYVMAYTNYV